MKGDILSTTDLLFLPEISVIIFVSVFVGAILWMYRPGSRQAYAMRSQMPLDDFNPVQPRSAEERG